MRKILRLVNTFFDKHIRVDYPVGIQVGAIAVMLIIFGLLYLLKNRFLPVALIAVCMV